MRLMARSETSEAGDRRWSGLTGHAELPDAPGVVFGRLRHSRLGRALRARPVVIDTVFALAVGLVVIPTALSSSPPPPQIAVVVLAVGVVGPLCLRRRYPGGTFTICAAALFVALILWGPVPEGFMPLAVAFYTVAKWCSRLVTIAAGLVLATWSITMSTQLGGTPIQSKGAIVFLMFSTAVTAGVLGFNANTRRAYLASIADRAARAERERDQRARIAAADERARIAREMHDIVAHNLSVMIALADGATFALQGVAASEGSPGAEPDESRPTTAARAVQAISNTGREALTQMRGLLGVLRDDTPRPGPSTAATLPSAATVPNAAIPPMGQSDSAASMNPARAVAEHLGARARAGNHPFVSAPGFPQPAGGKAAPPVTATDSEIMAPQPSLAELSGLIEQVRRAGLPVTVTAVGRRRTLPADAELTAFRIVQESLTNTLKHAGPGASATVTLRYDSRGLDLTITDPGGAARRPHTGAEADGLLRSIGGLPPGGRGLVGMYERAALHGGTLTAGPVGAPGAGWRVTARINVIAAPQPARPPAPPGAIPPVAPAETPVAPPGPLPAPPVAPA